MSSPARTQTDITEGVIWKQILLFFFPILFGTFFQQLYNTVDAIIVGRYLGKEALSAVGGGTGTVVNLLIGFFTGLTSGATVSISQFYGAKDRKSMHRAVHTAIAFVIAGGLVITATGIFYAPWMLRKLGTPDEILDPAIRYITIFFMGILPSIVYNMGASILRAVGDSRRPFYILIAGTFINIALDILFIAVLRLGVAGAAFATIISQTVTMVLVLLCLMRTTDIYRYIPKDTRFDVPMLKTILKLGLPTGFLSVMYTVSNLIIQSYVNSFGTNTIAAWAAYGKIDCIFWMMINSFGIAITTFAGQNFGAHKIDRVSKGTRQTLLMTFIATVFTAALFILFGRYMLWLFCDDQAVIDEGMYVINFLAPTYVLFLSIEVFSGAIRGCGKTVLPAVFTTCGVCLLRIVWLESAMPFWPDMLTVCAAYPISWTITSILYIAYYFWLKKRNFGLKAAAVTAE